MQFVTDGNNQNRITSTGNVIQTNVGIARLNVYQKQCRHLRRRHGDGSIRAGDDRDGLAERSDRHWAQRGRDEGFL